MSPFPKGLGRVEGVTPTRYTLRVRKLGSRVGRKGGQAGRPQGGNAKRNGVIHVRSAWAGRNQVRIAGKVRHAETGKTGM